MKNTRFWSTYMKVYHLFLRNDELEIKEVYILIDFKF